MKIYKHFSALYPHKLYHNLEDKKCRFVDVASYIHLKDLYLNTVNDKFLDMGLEDNGLRVGQVVEMVMEDTEQVVGKVIGGTQLEEDTRLNGEVGMESEDKVHSFVDTQDRLGMVDILSLQVDRELLKLVEGIRILMRLVEGMMVGVQVLEHMVTMRHDSLQAC